MATIMFFGEMLQGQIDDGKKYLEVGRSSFGSEDSMYIKLGEDEILLNQQDASKFSEAVKNCASYLALNKN